MQGVPDIRPVSPEPHHWAILPGADFADSFRMWLPEPLASQHVPQLMTRMMDKKPAWVASLLHLRNVLVAPLGLKSAKLAIGDHKAVGGFPVLDEADSHMLLGMDDSHLDFRLCIEKSGNTAEAPDTGHGSQQGQWLTVTTVVRTNRCLGKAYLATIMPFHRRIVPAMLEKLAA